MLDFFTEKGFRPALYYKANRTTNIQHSPTQRAHTHRRRSTIAQAVQPRDKAEGTAQQALKSQKTHATHHKAARRSSRAREEEAAAGGEVGFVAHQHATCRNQNRGGHAYSQVCRHEDDRLFRGSYVGLAGTQD